MAATTTLYRMIESILYNNGMNEFVDDDGNLIYFDTDKSAMKKILSFDEDIQEIVNDYFFLDLKLFDEESDLHFKKMFLFRFLNREINQQTMEMFSTKVVKTFMENERYLNMIYSDLERHLMNQSENEQTNKSKNTSDNRSAFADLPQNNVQIDVDNTVMESANDNTISRNKQVNEHTATSKSRQYNIDNIFKINGILEKVLDIFDVNCFMQVW